MNESIKEMWIYTINGMSNDCGKCCSDCKEIETCDNSCCNQTNFDCDDCKHD